MEVTMRPMWGFRLKWPKNEGISWAARLPPDHGCCYVADSEAAKRLVEPGKHC